MRGAANIYDADIYGGRIDRVRDIAYNYGNNIARAQGNRMVGRGTDWNRQYSRRAYMGLGQVSG